MSPELSVHTIDIKHKITAWEAKTLKQIFEVNLNEQLCTTKLYPKGIDELRIQENPVYEHGKITATTYDLCLKINVGKLLKISEVAMTVIDQKNVKKIIATLNRIMQKDLQLSEKNCNAEDWTLSRLDCGFDLIIPHESVQMLGIYIRLLHHALNLYNNRQCKTKAFKGSKEEKVLYESLCFGNDSYTYNIYLKYKQMLACYGEKAEEYSAEIKDLLRVEKQIFGKGIANCVGSPQKLSLLSDDTVIQKQSQSIIKEIKLFFGEGNFMSYDKAYEIIDQSHHDEEHKKTLKMMLATIAKDSFENYCKNLETRTKQACMDFNEQMEKLKQYRQDLEALGISVSGIRKNEAIIIGCDTLQGLYERIKPDASLPAVKRTKGKFATIIWNDRENRYKCNFTIHSIREGTRRIPKAHRDKEQLKLMIFKKLQEVYQANVFAVVNKESTMLDVVEKSKQDIELFKEVIGMPNLQIKINKNHNYEGE